jgi:hypothetical protein
MWGGEAEEGAADQHICLDQIRWPRRHGGGAFWNRELTALDLLLKSVTNEAQD